ncbi:MAG: carbon monoxide dehydrogenase subunit G [Chloroflexota bacterium]|nr:carbon monoxide dehydrogenase subunit G [Chloroflexota bacterium]
MKLNGNYTMNAPREMVFDTLMNVDALRNCLPGVDKFEQTGDGRYEARLRAGMAGVKGEFTGTISLRDPVAPESYTLAMEGTFSGGFVSGTGNVRLEDMGVQTKLEYSGDAQISGPLASVGQRLMAPAAKMIVGKFFRCMESQIQKQAAPVRD